MRQEKIKSEKQYAKFKINTEYMGFVRKSSEVKEIEREKERKV